ncbi:MAG: hypothetical protein JST84_02555 [Acidobacteria bacterium]|nr:hypothetical protein [Acidobacteriota bacterium]
MDNLIQFFFKYKPSIFAKGQLGLAARPSWLILLLLALAGGGLIYYLYFRGALKLDSWPRIGLAALRVALIAVLALLLMRPSLVVSSVIPKANYVAVLSDDSRSMQLNDENGTTRNQAVKNLLQSNGQFSKGLDEKFKTNYFKFASDTTKLTDANQLTAEGGSTDIAVALQQAVKDSSGNALAALVLISDGGMNTPRDIGAALRELRAKNLPVFTLGTGSTEKFKDAEMVRVNTPRRILTGSAVIADALVRLSGYESGKVTIQVTEDGHALKTEAFDIKGGEAQTVTLEFIPSSPGTHKYNFNIAPLEGEHTTEDNAQETLIEITNEQPKVLYIEGEPRWEYGKMRFSLSKNEKNVIVVSALRSADGKFYRQGVESGEQLEKGFPLTIEELFSYQGFVLGSIEANFFSFEQLRMIEQFVARRGGGFLALAGSRAFDAGKYANTPIGDLLPFILDDRVDGPEVSEPGAWKPVLTSRGAKHAITRLADNREQSAKEWEGLPPVTIPEYLTATKPGATVVLEARNTQDKSRTIPLLAEQRYGRGRTMALLTNDTWRWRMQLESKNTSHENFWRQALRYLVSTTPNPIEVLSERDVYAANDPVRLRGEVNDKKFEAIKDAGVTARITKPSGQFVEMPMTFNFPAESADVNDYQAEYKPDEQGLYKVELTAKKGGAVLGTAASSFLVTELNREFHDAAQNVELLKRIAAETGGKYFPLSKASDLIEELTYLEGKNSERISLDLWDMPINFLLLLGLASAEWFLRKRKGLA